MVVIGIARYENSSMSHTELNWYPVITKSDAYIRIGQVQVKYRISTAVKIKIFIEIFDNFSIFIQK